MFFFLIDSRAMFDASKTKVKTSHEIVCPEFKKYLKRLWSCVSVDSLFHDAKL
jgi:hypothetical protein